MRHYQEVCKSLPSLSIQYIKSSELDITLKPIIQAHLSLHSIHRYEHVKQHNLTEVWGFLIMSLNLPPGAEEDDAGKEQDGRFQYVLQLPDKMNGCHHGLAGILMELGFVPHRRLSL